MSSQNKKEQLLKILKELDRPGDPENAHLEADEALLEYIGDKEVTEAFIAIEKWYA